MTSLVSPAQVRALVKTSLSDALLQTVIDGEEALIVRKLGAHYVDGITTVVETLAGGGASLFVRRALTSISSVVEDSVTLTASDYRVWAIQGRVERLPAGSKWGEVITLTYVPYNDNDQRKHVITELVRLALERTAMQSESVAGEYSYQAPEWDAARAKLVRKLGFVNV